MVSKIEWKGKRRMISEDLQAKYDYVINELDDAEVYLWEWLTSAHPSILDEFVEYQYSLLVDGIPLR